MQLLTLLAIFGLQGCVFTTAAHSTAGRTDVIRNAIASSSYWNCYANHGENLCCQLKKVGPHDSIAALDSQPQRASAKRSEVGRAI